MIALLVLLVMGGSVILFALRGYARFIQFFNILIDGIRAELKPGGMVDKRFTTTALSTFSNQRHWLVRPKLGEDYDFLADLIYLKINLRPERLVEFTLERVHVDYAFYLREIMTTRLRYPNAHPYLFILYAWYHVRGNLLENNDSHKVYQFIGWSHHHNGKLPSLFSLDSNPKPKFTLQ